MFAGITFTNGIKIEFFTPCTFKTFKIKDQNMVIQSFGESKSAPLKKVFSQLISHLKEDSMKTLKGYGKDVKTTDVSWIVSVPAIWSDIAKAFMRDVCYKVHFFNAGLIVHEPIHLLLRVNDIKYKIIPKKYT